MKVIDIDCIHNKADVGIINQWVSQSIVRQRDSNGKEYVTPNEAIYWVSTSCRKKDIMDDMGLLKVGNFSYEDSLIEFLMRIIDIIDTFAVKNGLTALGEFRRECMVLTNRKDQMKDIQALKAIPIPSWTLGIGIPVRDN